MTIETWKAELEAKKYSDDDRIIEELSDYELELFYQQIIFCKYAKIPHDCFDEV